MVFNARSIARIVFGWAPEDNVAARETAWLDGVRGVAAFLVMINHYSMEWLSPLADAPFGAMMTTDWNPDGVWYHRAGEHLWAPWRLPILRLLMVSGGAQVSVFFVLSGMVLSWSPLGSVLSGNYEKLYTSLGSSTIRRWFRLFLPCAIVSLAYWVQRIVNDYQGIVPTLWSFLDYLSVTEQWANPFETAHVTQFSTNHGFNFVMWTIPFEFGGSIFVYVSLLGLGRVQSFRRRAIAIGLVSAYAFWKLQWAYWMFGTGIIISDYVRSSGGFRKLTQKTSTRAAWMWSLVLILGLILMGYVGPSERYSTPGYEWTAVVPLPGGFRFLIGEQRFWWGCGGILVILSSSHLSLVRKFFELAFIQYLGKISFMLYLIHFLINVVVAQPIRHAFYKAVCVLEFDEAYDGDVFRTTAITNVGIHIMLWLICIPLVMIISHILETFVDRPCTAFGKWLDDKLVHGTRKPVKPVDEEQEQLLESDMSGLELGSMPQRSRDG
ncbi:hypothetical protein AMS68_004584 [Peltaster fructicola]|uniref:Acyltransferase 3 domain-containing protein n=1 Tax=Peltaster fructicola TaxID=286661 RepID=A0A6H0XWC9_9PEZI|nr:hypothetical protein AMS68_004584 [Peltaster fructicola]